MRSIRSSIIPLFLVLIAGCSSSSGGGPSDANAQSAQLVQLVNTPLAVTLDGGVTLPAPIVNVTVPAEPPRQVIGFDRSCIGTTGEQVTVYTVPPGKTFVLTDMYAYGGGIVLRKIGTTPAVIYEGVNPSVHLNSGYEIPSGGQLLHGGGAGCAYLSGYLIPSS